tara:strand:- start:32 stop:157 length:126 start_codon:yes stop_codon:yes gene_type:complete
MLDESFSAIIFLCAALIIPIIIFILLFADLHYWVKYSEDKY